MVGLPLSLSGQSGPAARAALRGLPDRQREALILRYYLDLNEEQIAATMGTSMIRVTARATAQAVR